VPIGVFGRPQRFKSLSGKLWGQEISCGLDPGMLINRTLGRGIRDCGVVIFGPDGKALWRGLNFRHSTMVFRGSRKLLIPSELEKRVKPHLSKGILGGVEIPPMLKPIAALIKAGRLGQAQLMISRLPSRAPYGELKQTVLGRLEEVRTKKRALFDELVAAEKKWDAFKVGSSYVRCFPRAKDASKVRSALSSLKMRPPVKDEYAAKQNFTRLAVLGYGSFARGGSGSRVHAVMASLAKKYPDTEFGRFADALSK
jgi:hypothetical protein